MSYIRWQTPSGDDVRIAGWERAWLGGVVADVATAFIPTHDNDSIRARIAPGHYMAQMQTDPWRYRDGVITSARVGFDDEPLFLDHDGTPLRTFSLLLNTVLAVGSDAACLLARVHGQCELHCYVEGPNRAWLADVVEQGRSTGLLRAGAGWEQLVDLLRARADEPVVADYSVSDGFLSYPPDSWSGPTADQDDDEDEARERRGEAWDGLPATERWSFALAVLRSQPERELELLPGNLRGRFGHGRSLIDLFVTSPAPAAAAR